MKKAAFALAATLVCCAAQSPAAPRLSTTARALFERQDLKGALYSEDIRTGKAVADFDTGGGALDVPLSPVKLLLVSSYFEHERELPPTVRPDVQLIVARGSDDAARKLARDLRSSLGSAAVLRDLARFGFPACSRLRPTNCTTLTDAAKDSDWADALSLGETQFRITTRGLSHFLRMTALALQSTRGSTLSHQSALQLREAMLETVQLGTAKGSGDILVGLGAMGGKTGSTAINGANPLDGLFAGLVFDPQGRPRFTIVTFVRRHGVGGGVAAHLSGNFAVAALKN